MQLLKITSIPIKYSIKIEHAKLQPNKGGINSDNTINIDVKNNSAQKIDTFNREKTDLGQKTPDLRLLAAKISSNGSQEVIAKNEIQGMGNSGENNYTVADVLKEKLLQEALDKMVFIPNSGPQTSFNSECLNTEFTPANLDLNWKINPDDLDFVPGSFIVNVEQYPEIKIEYLGKPMYIPPSADPEFKDSDK